MTRGSAMTRGSVMQQTDVLEGPAEPNMLLNSLAVNVKVCKELLKQAQASLHCLEAQRRQSQRTCSVPGPSHSAAGRAVAPPSACYTLFRLLPQDSVWAKNLENQLCTHTYELLPKEQLAAALRFLTEGPTEECTLYQTAEEPTQVPSLHQSVEHLSAEYRSAEGLTEGPTLYQSVLDLSPENTQEQQLRRGAQMQDLSDCRCPSEISEEGPPSSLQPSMGLLHIEVGDLSSITHSPHHQKILLFKRHLVPCNSTPRSTGVQLISGLVSSPYTSQSYCTAVDESASLSQPNLYPAVRAAAARGQHQGQGDLTTGMKRVQEELLFESEGTAEEKSEGTDEAQSERTAEEKSEGTDETQSEGTSEGEVQDGEVKTKDWGLASHHQLYISNMDIRSHLTLDNDLDSAEKDSALVYKVVSRSESREGQESGESLPCTLPSYQSEDTCSHERGEPQWASLLTKSYRAHSTLDDILQAHMQD